MTIQIAYRVHENWNVMSDFLCNPRKLAVEYALVIDGQRTFQNESFDKVVIVASRVKHTAKLLELSQIS